MNYTEINLAVEALRWKVLYNEMLPEEADPDCGLHCMAGGILTAAGFTPDYALEEVIINVYNEKYPRTSYEPRDQEEAIA